MTAAGRMATEAADSNIADVVRAWLARQRECSDVVGIQRRPWEYATSAALELVTVALADGTRRELVLKHLGRRHLSGPSRRVKPAFVIDPQREIEVYRRLLAPLRIGPGLVACTNDPQLDVHWLLIERVRGAPLYEAGEPATWADVAYWLGQFHSRLARLDSEPLRQEARLIRYDRAWYTVWMKRALRVFASTDPPHSRQSRSALRWLADRYDTIVAHLMSLPATIIHGEFYASNVLVAGTPGSSAVYPIDWETAAVGPAVLDLAALASGGWHEQDRRTLVSAYLSGSSGPFRVTVDEVARSVEYGLIHLAVQWLGWFGRRQAPTDHAHDWLSDAVNRAEALNL